MSITEYTALGALIVTIIVLVMRISHVLDHKVSYESFDRHKREVEGKFRTEKTCDILRHNMEQDISEIKAKVQDIDQIKVGINTLLNRKDRE